jgi:hypothetical protein
LADEMLMNTKKRYMGSEDVGPNESFINRAYSNELPPGS